MDEEEKKMRKLAEEADERDLPSNPRPPKAQDFNLDPVRERKREEQRKWGPANALAGHHGSIEGFVPMLAAGILKRTKREGGFQYSMRTSHGAFATNNLKDALREARRALSVPPADDTQPRQLFAGEEAIDNLKMRNRKQREEWEKWKFESEKKLDKLNAKYPAT